MAIRKIHENMRKQSGIYLVSDDNQGNTVEVNMCLSKTMIDLVGAWQKITEKYSNLI